MEVNNNKKRAPPATQATMTNKKEMIKGKETLEKPNIRLEATIEVQPKNAHKPKETLNEEAAKGVGKKMSPEGSKTTATTCPKYGSSACDI